jgi:hypothetical protein
MMPPLDRPFRFRMRLLVLANAAGRTAMHGLIGLGGFFATIPSELIVTMLDETSARRERRTPVAHPEHIPLTTPTQAPL